MRLKRPSLVLRLKCWQKGYIGLFVYPSFQDLKCFSSIFALIIYFTLHQAFAGSC